MAMIALADSPSQLTAVGQALAKRTFLFASDLAAALRPFDEDDRQVILAAFLAAGGQPDLIASALPMLRQVGVSAPSRTYAIVWGVLGTASMAASAFHGYRRHRSVGAAIGWAILGSLFPGITPAVAVAQGFGKPK